ncbi:tRNA (guanosine(18)-2'-O)-methyltransferase TrmH [Spongiibacter taiwanensis]
MRAVLDRRQPDLSLITDNVHKGRNLSAVIRNADAAGVSTLHCVLEEREYRAFRGTAMGSQQWVEVRRHPDISGAIARLQAEGVQVLAAHLSEVSVDYREVDYTRPTAILLGAEKRGVSSEALALADAHITIPMVGMVQSYNVSVASGILLAEAQYQRQKAGMYDQRRLPDDVYERLFFEWAHPELTRFCQQRGLAYPPLGEDGELQDPPGWYAEVRAGRAAMVAG